MYRSILLWNLSPVKIPTGRINCQSLIHLVGRTCHGKVNRNYETPKKISLLDKDERNVSRKTLFLDSSKFENGFMRRIPKTLVPYAKLIRLDKPIGIWLLLWPCYWSIGLAADAGMPPNLYMLTMFGLGAVSMRSAGCIWNDVVDKEYDAQVDRTKSRPLASKQLSRLQAAAFGAGVSSIGALVLFQFDVTSIIIGMSSLALVAIYPMMKRYTYWPQIFLGLTFNYGAILGWSATTGGHINLAAVIPLYCAGICWTLVYDTIYAHQDKYDDMKLGLKSTAILFGDNTKQILGLFAGGMVSMLTLAGLNTAQCWPYYGALGLTSAYLFNQIKTLDTSNPDDCADKFRKNTAIGYIMFIGIVLSNLFKKKSSKTDESGADTLISSEIDQIR